MNRFFTSKNSSINTVAIIIFGIATFLAWVFPAPTIFKWIITILYPITLCVTVMDMIKNYRANV